MRLFLLNILNEMKLKILKNKQELDHIRRLLKDFYEDRSDEYGLMDRPQSDYEEYIEVINRWTPEEGIVLDLGCGTYRTPEMLQKRGFKATGCDFFNHTKINEYQKIVGKDGPDFVAYEGENLPFNDETFHTVASLCMFEHITTVDHLLSEIKRILKPEGSIIIMGPNIAGPHRVILGIKKIIQGKGRYWQFKSILECIVGGFKIAYRILGVYLSRKPRFIYVYPLMENDDIKFEQSDDDAVHLNAPISFKKWFRQNGFVLDQYNRGVGDTTITRFFNNFFPSLATKVQIVARKK